MASAFPSRTRQPSSLGSYSQPGRTGSVFTGETSWRRTAPGVRRSTASSYLRREKSGPGNGVGGRLPGAGGLGGGSRRVCKVVPTPPSTFSGVVVARRVPSLRDRSLDARPRRPPVQACTLGACSCHPSPASLARSASPSMSAGSCPWSTSTADVDRPPHNLRRRHSQRLRRRIQPLAELSRHGESAKPDGRHSLTGLTSGELRRVGQGHVESSSECLGERQSVLLGARPQAPGAGRGQPE